MTLTAGELFAGYGGLALSVEEVFGAETKWVAEFDKAPSKILEQRFPGVPNLHDVTQVDWSKVEPVDIISGGSPCQDISQAGARWGRMGMTEGTRSNLWSAQRESIARLNPTWVVWENVRGATSARATSEVESEPGLLGNLPRGHRPLRALGRVLGDLADLGFDAEWRGIEANDVGAPHGRYRIFVLAHRRGAPVLPAADDSGAGSRRRAPAPRESSSRGQDAQALRATGGPVPPRGTPWAGHAPAIDRWERLTGRPAPRATEPVGRNGRHGMTPAFGEWHMGLPEGWVTDTDTTRREQLKALGNGVHPLQSSVALADMLRTFQQES